MLAKEQLGQTSILNATSSLFEIKKFYQEESNLKAFIQEITVPKVNDVIYVINLDECKSMGAHLIANFVKKDIFWWIRSYMYSKRT